MFHNKMCREWIYFTSKDCICLYFLEILFLFLQFGLIISYCTFYHQKPSARYYTNGGFHVHLNLNTNMYLFLILYLSLFMIFLSYYSSYEFEFN